MFTQPVAEVNQDKLMSKLSQKYYENKQQQTACDYSWQIQNVRERLDYLEFLLSQIVEIIDNNPKLTKGV